MGIKDSKHEMRNQFSRFENNGDVINGNCTKVYNNYQFDKIEIYEALTEKDNYSEFYKRYISKFEELNDYAFSLFYPKVIKKSFEFTSKPLVMGKKIINWIYGLKEFPGKEIQEFYEDLKMDFDFNENMVIVKRWNANSDYFNNNIKQASENYDKLYDELITNKDIPDWYLDDICIDGRNLLAQYENTQNKYSLDNKFQKTLDSNKHKLSYPDIDRIKAEIFENVSKHIFNNKNKSKYTTIYGIGLKECFSKIQNLIFLTIFYGSITHLKLVRQLISNIMYMYADTFDEEEFYNLTLRMLFLSGEFKKYRNLYNKIKLTHSFVISSNFIGTIAESRKALFKFEHDRNNIFLFDIYGRYINDDLYEQLESNIFGIIKIDEDYQINLINDAFKSIASNIKRLNNLNILLEILKDYFDKSYSRFYIEFGRILNEIDVDKLTQSEFQNYQNVIDLLIKEKEHINYDISNCIIAIKKRDKKINKYDNLIAEAGTNENIVYQIELENKELEAIKSIVKIYRKRHEEREKQPGFFHEYAVDYDIGIGIFTDKAYTDDVRKFILDEYLPLAKSIILSENEDNYEKNRHIKLLAHLLMIEKDKEIVDDIICVIHKAKEIKSVDIHRIGIARLRNELDLNINIMMCDVIIENISYNEALCNWLEIAVKYKENIEEILDCVFRLNIFLKNKNQEIIEKLYILFHICYQINDVDIRNDIVIMSQIFLHTKYQENIIKILEERVANICFEECRGYIQLIMNSKERDVYNSLILKLKTNNNYYVKYMVNKYL